MKIDQQNRNQVIIFSLIAAVLLGWFVYAGNTGWRIFNTSGNQEAWASRGPGYHK